jgi:GNAT superfamily N-acetyltransferase
MITRWEPENLRGDGALIRVALPADVPGIARVHVDAWRSTYRGIVPGTALAARSYAEHERKWKQRVHASPGAYRILVAADRGQGVVGFAHGGPRRAGPVAYAGELYAIYILEAHQRRGLGRRLVLTMAQWLVERGVVSMLVWVFAGNPAHRFYETLGARRVDAKRVAIGGADLEEVAYGWADLDALVRAERGT